MSAFRGKAWNNEGQGGGDRPVCPAGEHMARLVALIDLGTHFVPDFGDSSKGKKKRKCVLIFETVDEAGSFFLPLEKIVSFHAKAGIRILMKEVFGKEWADGEEIDYASALSLPCQVSVENGQSQKGNAYATLKVVARLHPKLVKNCPSSTVDPLFYDMESGEQPPDHSWMPFLFGKSVKSVIEESDEWQARTGVRPPRQQVAAQPAATVSAGGLSDDDVPF